MVNFYTTSALTACKNARYISSHWDLWVGNIFSMGFVGGENKSDTNGQFFTALQHLQHVKMQNIYHSSHWEDALPPLVNFLVNVLDVL